MSSALDVPRVLAALHAAEGSGAILDHVGNEIFCASGHEAIGPFLQGHITEVAAVLALRRLVAGAGGAPSAATDKAVLILSRGDHCEVRLGALAVHVCPSQVGLKCGHCRGRAQ